ncbi:MAG: hypothetical protein K5837_03155 [Candidatus Saccharibacteria bacterium]|nr:hypothetical protein [Candidatus Saccharibacteria bacterium]
MKKTLSIALIVTAAVAFYIFSFRKVGAEDMRCVREYEEALTTAKASVVENYEPDVDIDLIQVHLDDRLGICYFIPMQDKMVAIAPETKTGQLIHEAVRAARRLHKWDNAVLVMLCIGAWAVFGGIPAVIAVLTPSKE